MILQVTLALAALSVAASNPVCCPPSRFSAFQHLTVSNSTTTTQGLHYFVWDGPNQRYFFGENRVASNYYGTKKTIYDYKKGTAYRIDSVARTCTTFPTQGKFLDQENVCVPGGAVNQGPLFFGYDQDTLHGTAYSSNSTTPDGRQQNVIAVVSKDCIPIISNTIITGNGEGGKVLYVKAYVYIFPGVKDVSLFNIPSYCYA
ncbi:ependymin-related protein 2-like [Haliotis rubra]|uniref:ependymin-related protein 2-like n=1 Tax=Haliotis rubra TaxID=36100 RepID=UPI001EE5259E|nr:ependymin-related protein 2-like [Haliotis rubra]